MSDIKNKTKLNRHLRRKITERTNLTLERLASRSQASNINNIDDSFHFENQNCLLDFQDDNFLINYEQDQPITTHISLQENNCTYDYLPRNIFHKSLTDINVNKNIEFETVVDDSETFKETFVTKLKMRAINNNVTHKSLNELIPLIKYRFSFLPNDARTILGTPRSIQTIQLNSGEMG